ncbi:MAG: type II toxin-antitoxin system VapC family toxin [Gammaproteobacteria bacterium]
MNVLLDTHVFLWAVMQPDQLSSKVRRLLENSKTDVTVSAASAWEIGTKFRLGKLPGAKLVVGEFEDAVRRLHARSLPIINAHAMLAGSYPQDHRDPFDRILAAQAEIEGLVLVSKDRALRQFGVKLLW